MKLPTGNENVTYIFINKNLYSSIWYGVIGRKDTQIIMIKKVSNL